MNSQTNTNDGGGFGLAEGQLATAGAIGTWTADLAYASAKNYFSIALLPVPAGGGGGIIYLTDDRGLFRGMFQGINRGMN